MNSYLKSIKKIKNADLLFNLRNTIENLEQAKSITTITGIKKLTSYSNCFRIKIEDYRIGLVIENNTATLVQFQHRKDIYKKFP